MTAAGFKAWINQPSTITGLGAFAATAAGLITHVLTHDTTAEAAAGAAAFALVHVVLPDNTAAQSSVEKLVTDSITAVAQQRLAAAMPLLVQDGMAVLTALRPTTTVVTTVDTGVPTTGGYRPIGSGPAPAPERVENMQSSVQPPTTVTTTTTQQ